jgi:hypothetical protein
MRRFGGSELVTGARFNEWRTRVSAELPDDWNDVTAQHGPRELLAALVPPESGTHRIARPRALGELQAPRHLDRDALSSLVTEYLSYFAGPARGAALRAVREGLDAVGGVEHAVPQALAGQLVLALANQLSRAEDREGFLATAWVILASTGMRVAG